eukprot:gene29878-36074_t
MQVIILLCILPWIQSLRLSVSFAPRLGRTALHASKDPVVVVGAAGGAAEVLAVKLALSRPVTLYTDQTPFSPRIATETLNIKVITSDAGDSDQLKGVLQGTSAVVALEDAGDPTLRGEEGQRDIKNSALELMQQLSKVLPGSPNVGPVVLGLSAALEQQKASPLSFLGGRGATAIKTWCKQANHPLSALQFGKLTGGVPDREPLPFVSLPLQDPTLHPSYKLTSALLTAAQGNSRAAEQPCTRAALADAIANLLAQTGEQLAEDALLVSVEGPALTPENWTKLFQRLRVSDQGAIELLAVDFKALNAAGLLNYLRDDWFPKALVTSEAATSLTGARATRCRNVGTSALSIAWEDLRRDLTVVSVGQLLIEVQGTTGAEGGRLVVRRQAPSLLPGEGRIIDQLVETLQGPAAKKNLCTLA